MLRSRVFAADAERELAAAALAEHYAAGRLALPELEARVTRVYDARTRGQIAGALNRLPRAERRRRLSVLLGLAVLLALLWLRVTWFVVRRGVWPLVLLAARAGVFAVARRRRMHAGVRL